MEKGLYKLFNMNIGEYGEPFAMCDKCFDEWSKTEAFKKGTFIIKKIADKALEPCNQCGK